MAKKNKRQGNDLLEYGRLYNGIVKGHGVYFKDKTIRGKRDYKRSEAKPALQVMIPGDPERTFTVYIGHQRVQFDHEDEEYATRDRIKDIVAKARTLAEVGDEVRFRPFEATVGRGASRQLFEFIETVETHEEPDGDPEGEAPASDGVAP